MSKKDKATGQEEPQAPGGGKKKGRKSRRGSGEAPGGELAIRVGAHPRARRSVRRVRAQAGIAGFAVTLLLAHQAGVPAFEALVRALAGGVLLHFVAWAFAITLWRRLIVAELEAAGEEVMRRREAAGSPDAGSAGVGAPAAAASRLAGGAAAAPTTAMPVLPGA